MDNCSRIKQPTKEVGYLVHVPTRTILSVYKKMDPFRKFMLKLCFDLKYEEIKK